MPAKDAVASPKERGVEDYLLWALTALAILSAVAVFCVIGLRIAFPYQLEVNETMVWELTDRVFQGKSVYVKPSVEFTPVLYPPVYLYLGAALLKLFGSSFSTLRMISLFATCGSVFLIFRAVKLRTHHWKYGIIAVGLFMASYQRSGFWMDLARLDSLWVFFLLLSFSLLPTTASKGQLAVFLGAYLAALFTKQTTLFFAPAFGLALFRLAPSGGWVRVATFAGSQIACLMILHLVTSGWFSFYCFKVPGGHGIYTQRFEEFWQNAAGPTVLALLPAGLLFITVLGVHPVRRLIAPLPLFAVSAIAAAILGSMKIGGSWNHFIPLFAFNAIWAGVLLARWGEHFIPRSGLRATQTWARLIPIGCCLGQFIFFWHNPAGALPSPHQVESLRNLDRAISAAPRPIFCKAPFNYLLLKHQEHPTHVNPDALQDLRWAGLHNLARPLEEELERLINTGHFRTLVLYEHHFNALSPEARSLYSNVTNFPVATFESPSVLVLSRP